eukprot:Blabericola_migrator_1__166@NODE_1043_length_5621_cov_191_151602_g718_i0_p2_GENE_NODE_1043_length_5621_cov_191_151602_g718_i0NODE_1043_length_5621_cov_191_151602_g718_i0_p2_ORF_typecomplete_len461_score44_03Peptidase_C97/PF05903_14/2_2e33_NODE_1043_length_5621_cov_191_151602_g718_i01541536
MPVTCKQIKMDLPVERLSGRRNAVKLRVYDISGGAASRWSPIVLGRKLEGIWHSGIEVFGYEYFYGGGVVKMRPENVERTFGIRPAHVHHLGYTDTSRSQFERWLISIMPSFKREVYDLVEWNCNHFTNHVSEYLVSRPIPDYILDLPKEVCNSFMGKILLLFLRMIQGGNAPIAINDPQHPSKMLGGSTTLSSNSSTLSTATSHPTRPRRYSCPASPMGDNLLSQSCGPSSQVPVTAADFKAAGLSPRQNSVRLKPTSASKTRLQTVDPPLALATKPTARRRDMLGPSSLASGVSIVNVLSQEDHRRAPFLASNGAHTARVTFRDSAPAAPSTTKLSSQNSETASEVSNRTSSDRLQKVPGSAIGPYETAVLFSPKHRRLYELERDKLTMPITPRDKVTSVKKKRPATAPGPTHLGVKATSRSTRTVHSHRHPAASPLESLAIKQSQRHLPLVKSSVQS